MYSPNERAAVAESATGATSLPVVFLSAGAVGGDAHPVKYDADSNDMIISVFLNIGFFFDLRISEQKTYMGALNN